MKIFLVITTLISVSAFAKELKVAHGSATTAYTNQAVSQFEKEGPEKVKLLRNEGMSAENVAAAVDAGNAEVGIIGVDWKTVESVLKERKVSLQNAGKISTIPLGEDLVLFITYSGGPRELSKSQLKQILTKQVGNWNQVGGEAKDIQLVIPKNIGGTTKLIRDTLLDGQEIELKGAKIVETLDEAAELIAKTPGAFGIATKATKTTGVNKPLTPKVAKPVNAIYVGAPSASAKKFIDLYTKVVGK